MALKPIIAILLVIGSIIFYFRIVKALRKFEEEQRYEEQLIIN